MSGNQSHQLNPRHDADFPEDEVPTLSSVVLSGDETVIHSARLKHNLGSQAAFLTEERFEELLSEFRFWSLEDLDLKTLSSKSKQGEFICESDLAVLISKIIEAHSSRMRAEIAGLLEAHGIELEQSDKRQI